MLTQARSLIFFRLLMLPSFIVLVSMSLSGCGEKIDNTQYEAAGNVDEDDEQFLSDSSKSDESKSVSSNDSAEKSKSSSVPNDKKNKENSPSGNPEIAKSKPDTSTHDSQKSATDPDAEKSEAPSSNFDRTLSLSPDLEMPEGTTNDLLIYWQKLEQIHQQITSVPNIDEKRVIEVNIARLRVAERLSRATQLEFKMMQVKINALAILRGLAYPGADTELDQFAESLIKSDNPDIADFGHIHLLRKAFFTVLESEEDAPEIEKFLADIERLATMRPNSLMLYRNVEEGVFDLFRKGKRETGIRAMKTAVNGFAKSENAEIQDAVDQMREHVVVTESKFDLIAYDYAQNPDHLEEILAGIKMILKQPKIGRVVLSDAMTQALNIEEHQNYKEAIEAYTAIKETYSKHENRDLAKLATRAADMGIKRNELVGKKLVLEGNTLTGERLDWSEFRDKVVLATFWRSNSDASVRTIGLMEEFCDQNEELGIELIAVNLDDDPRIVLRQLAGRGPDWILLITNDITQAGFNSPMAVRCGVNEVPFTILIDKNGRVADVAIKGKAVSRAVANLFDREVKDIDGIIKPDETDSKKSGEATTPQSEAESDGDTDTGSPQESSTTDKEAAEDATKQPEKSPVKE